MEQLACCISDGMMVPQHEQASCSAAAEATCRVCWGSAGEGEGQQLLSPCHCSGSIEHVHASCLARWQRQLWDAGHYRRALHCDVCRSPYAEWCLNMLLDGGGPLLRTFPALHSALHTVAALAADPERALHAWRWCVLLSGLAAGTRRGITGLRAGLALGLSGARPLAALTLRLAPQLTMLGMALPAAVPLLQRALRCSVMVMLAQVLLSSAGGLLTGGALGFAAGAASAVRGTAVAGAQGAVFAAGLAARLAGTRHTSLLAAALLKGSPVTVQPRLLLAAGA